MPSASTAIVWKRPQTSRSSRAGMLVSIKAEAGRVLAPTSVVVVSTMGEKRRHEQARSAYTHKLVPGLNREIEDGVGIRLRLEREMPPLLRVIFEAMRLHSLDKQRAVLALLIGEPWNDRVRLGVEAVEARSHGDAAIGRVNGLRRRARPRLTVFGDRRRLGIGASKRDKRQIHGCAARMT